MFKNSLIDFSECVRTYYQTTTKVGLRQKRALWDGDLNAFSNFGFFMVRCNPERSGPS